VERHAEFLDEPIKGPKMIVEMCWLDMTPRKTRNRRAEVREAARCPNIRDAGA
jgi:hypothetical protein